MVNALDMLHLPGVGEAWRLFLCIDPLGLPADAEVVETERRRAKYIRQTTLTEARLHYNRVNKRLVRALRRGELTLPEYLRLDAAVHDECESAQRRARLNHWRAGKELDRLAALARQGVA